MKNEKSVPSGVDMVYRVAYIEGVVLRRNLKAENEMKTDITKEQETALKKITEFRDKYAAENPNETETQWVCLLDVKRTGVRESVAKEMIARGILEARPTYGFGTEVRVV